MIHDDCPTDLIAKERRHELSPLERRALQVHLARCESCRAWQQIGRDFDADAAPSVDDAAVVKRIVDGVRRSASTPGSRSLRRKTRARAKPVRWLLLAALATTAAAAAAVTGWQIARDVPPPEVDRTLTSNLGPSASPSPSVASLGDAPQSEPEPLGAPANSESPASARDAVPEGSGASKTTHGGSRPSTVSALSIYREANQARRKGDVARAISLFRQLQQAFPRSPEAHLSNVALGGALLDSGASREALHQFERYLASGGQKTLAAEALYGRARALGRLGNRAEERAAWLRLNREFPGSPYTATATRRLEALE